VVAPSFEVKNVAAGAVDDFDPGVITGHVVHDIEQAIQRGK